MKWIEKAQEFLKEEKIDGWLLYDFHGKNTLAHKVLKIPAEKMTTRRFFYWIPKEGSSIKIVHAIEEKALDHLPGEKKIYSSWQSLFQELKKILPQSAKVAMEYSPNNEIPYVSLVDGGTIDLIRSFGIQVVSSCHFLPYFTATLSQEEIASQKRATQKLDQIVLSAWDWIKKALETGEKVREIDVQKKILQDFQALSLFSEDPPIVAINEHSADPHFETTDQEKKIIEKGDWILIDLWAKEKGGIYGDLTRVAVAGEKASPQQEKIFQIVRNAQKNAIDLVRSRFSKNQSLQGWEVDEAARSVIREAGYEKYFIHRTGHNIESDLHGSGANMDNLEMHDTRPIIQETCFSIEPGIYLPGEFGVRLEIDLIITSQKKVELSGFEQEKIFYLSSK